MDGQGIALARTALAALPVEWDAGKSAEVQQETIVAMLEEMAPGLKGSFAEQLREVEDWARQCSPEERPSLNSSKSSLEERVRRLAEKLSEEFANGAQG